MLQNKDYVIYTLQSLVKNYWFRSKIYQIKKWYNNQKLLFQWMREGVPNTYSVASEQNL